MKFGYRAVMMNQDGKILTETELRGSPQDAISCLSGIFESPEVSCNACGSDEGQDPTNPSYYRRGDVECIDAIEAALGQEQFIGFLRGQVIKYNWRLGYKDHPIQEVRKGTWYQHKLYGVLERESCAKESM